jgi:hypothetical protein
MGWARPLLHCLGSRTGEEGAEKKREARIKVKRSSMDNKAAAGAVASFHELHRKLSRYGKDWIFRGHADVSWELIPKAGRAPYAGHEQALFELWKLSAVEHLASHITSDWDWRFIRLKRALG